MNNDVILSCDGVSKTYHDGTSYVHVLNRINLAVARGERLAIIGPSGSGKSTLLHLLGGLDQPTIGDVRVNGINWRALSEKKRCRTRNRQLGFIYQFHHLLPEFTALENVAMPLLLGHMSVSKATDTANEILKKVGLEHRVTHKPAELSGGERQRVAIARALVHNPHCVLADEPTGNLDHTTATRVFDLMLDLNKQLQTALVVVTHDQSLAARMDKIFLIQDGTLSEFHPAPSSN